MSKNNDIGEVQYLNIKLKNRRIKVFFYVDKEVVRVKTKRLVSLNDREITETDTLYSKETIYGISHLLDLMIDGSKEFRSFIERAAHNFSQETIEGSTNLSKLVDE